MEEKRPMLGFHRQNCCLSPPCYSNIKYLQSSEVVARASIIFDKISRLKHSRLISFKVLLCRSIAAGLAPLWWYSQLVTQQTSKQTVSKAWSARANSEDDIESFFIMVLVAHINNTRDSKGAEDFNKFWFAGATWLPLRN